MLLAHDEENVANLLALSERSAEDEPDDLGIRAFHTKAEAGTFRENVPEIKAEHPLHLHQRIEYLFGDAVWYPGTVGKRKSSMAASGWRTVGFDDGKILVVQLLPSQEGKCWRRLATGEDVSTEPIVKSLVSKRTLSGSSITPSIEQKLRQLARQAAAEAVASTAATATGSTSSGAASA